MNVLSHTPRLALPPGDSDSVVSITAVPPRPGQGTASTSTPASSGHGGGRIGASGDARTRARLQGTMRRPAAAGSTGPDAGNVRNLDEGVAHAANAARKEGLLDEEDERQMASQTPSEQLHTLVEALRRAIKHLADDLKEQPEASRDSADEARLYTQQETLEALLKVMQGLESGTAASPRPATGSGGTGDPGGPGGTGGPAGAADAEGDHKAHASKEEKPRAERDPGNLQDMMSEFMKMQEMLSTVQGMIIDTFLSQLKMLTEMIKKINEIATSAI